LRFPPSIPWCPSCKAKGVNFTLSVVKFAHNEKTNITTGFDGGYNGAYAVISKKPIRTSNDVTSVAASLNSISPKGGTYMVPGLEVAANQFTKSQDTEKVFVMLADGDYNDHGNYVSTGEARIKNAANTIRKLGATLYTIGFVEKVPILSAIASEGKYSTADSDIALNQIFTQITDEISAAMTDSMGNDVSLVASTLSGNGAAADENGTITWNLGTLEKDKAQTITYTAALKELKVGTQKYYLNGTVALNYNNKTLNVPAPYITLSAYQLTTEIYVNGQKVNTTTGDITEWTEASAANWTQDAYSHQGQSYAFSKATLDDVQQTGTSASLTAAAHTLKLYYTSANTIQYYLDGAEQESLKQTLHYGDPVTAQALPTVTGSTVSGWFSDADCTVDAQFPATMPASNLKFYAKSTKNDYTIQYYLDGAEQESLKQTLHYGDPVTAQTLPTVTGSTVSGWFSDTDCTVNAQFPATMPASNLKFYAKSTEDDQSISISVPISKEVKQSGSRAPGEQTFTFELSGLEGEVNYQLSGNTIKTKGTGTFEGTLTITVPNESEFQKLSNGFKITEKNDGKSNWKYDATEWYVVPTLQNDGAVSCVYYNLTEGDKIGETQTAYNGLQFINTYKYTSVTPPSHDYYTLTYVSNGGTAYNPERYVENTTVTLSKSPTRAGYTFTGWYSDEACTEKITEIKMDSNKTVYAGWTVTPVPPDLTDGDHFAYVIGYTDGTVRPNANITRAEVCTIFFRLLKDEVRDENLAYTNNFEDVTEDMWCNTAISTMAKLGIVKGRTPTTFAPSANITRAEFAAICARFDDSVATGTSDFTDIDQHWAEAEIERAATLGWVTGYPNGTFGPNNSITRAEAMTMINRVLQRIPETASDLLDDMKVWPDNEDPSAWCYLAVQEATNSHKAVRKENNYEKWESLIPDPDWTRYQ
jgi:uncharacterized repeat protein (TIGR02543 family)